MPIPGGQPSKPARMAPQQWPLLPLEPCLPGPPRHVGSELCLGVSWPQLAERFLLGVGGRV